MTRFLILLSVSLAAAVKPCCAADRLNIIVVFADDISARELPIYGSSVWSPPLRGDTSDPKYRASTPVLDRLAHEGCWIKTAWASVVCSPSRAMMMTGRYAHQHKWWGNKSKGKYVDETGREVTWPLYLSSPHQIGHIAQLAGYRSYWAGKTQMAGDLNRFGFDHGCFTPGNYDTHGTVTQPGIHSHINYLDYQAWLYQNKLKELGIADNTIFISLC